MKTLKLVPLFLIAFLFCNYTAIAQEEEEEEIENELTTITAVYEGIEDSMYVFTYEDEDGEESTISFQKIAPEAEKAYDLLSKKLIGKAFEITYSDENVLEDDDLEILTNIRTIETLKQL
ncbi:hypothetical protein Q4Q39_20430 [Flavivirga amylovorans]|uniref:Uncharacterized protein n=1 Tax=Flavivirga amylovorans TaxID=870486 RepID=A0ABT8X749_9FLAO|nr:hypothetical protein [Flavivirga amylovorans]MDO5989777.1 hypothetical protein [Flavivirga amylovorans]